MLNEWKDYQRDAVDELKEYFELYLKKTGKSITFKSPTGSGKTYMASLLIEELVSEHNDEQFCFIWASIGKGELQKQSYDSVGSHLCGNPVCTLLEEEFFGSRKYIKNHEVIFVNWEKLVDKDRETGKWKNNLMKDKEGQNFLNVLQETRENGTKIILIVDESHIGAGANTRIAEFKEQIICADITLEMSATPLTAPDIEVNPQRVIDEGMIKEDIIVNEGIRKGDISNEDKDSELLVLEKAEAKRQQLIAEYKNVGAHVNPLVLIQIPNVDAGEAKKLVVKDFLREKDITEDNGKLKLWCDNAASFDKKAIKKNDDETCYLIFKTAVATGWDCPRAHILVKFREGHSETFEIQTVGRILRTAEATKYENSVLDNAYIFTNIKEFETKQDTYNPNKIKTEFAYMKEPYTIESVFEQTQLDSFYRSREGDYNSADSRFGKYFEKAFMDFFGFSEEDKKKYPNVNKETFKKKGFNIRIDTHDALITETVVSVLSVDSEQHIGTEAATVRMSDSDIQATYYSLIKSNMSGLAYVRSKGHVNAAVVEVFTKFYNTFKRSEKVSSVQKIMVENSVIFEEILAKATASFREMLQKNAGLKGVHYDFRIEDKRGYSNETHKKLDASKSLYQPLYVLVTDTTTGAVNELEKSFIEYLHGDGDEAVEWFWENGTELMRINFGIEYDNGMSTFQPDFLVKFTDGTVGIFDTKPINYRIDDTKFKAEALYKYLDDNSKIRGKAPKIIGGIVVNSGTQFYYYNEAEYCDYAASTDNWHNFNELLREHTKKEG